MRWRNLIGASERWSRTGGFGMTSHDNCAASIIFFSWPASFLFSPVDCSRSFLDITFLLFAVLFIILFHSITKEI